MTYAPSPRRPLHALLVAAALGLPLVWTAACGGLGLEDEGETGDAEDGGESGDAALGDTPLPACEAAMFALEQIFAEVALPNPDPAYIIELYRGDPPDFSGESPTPGGTAVQRWVREVGARLGRVEAGMLTDDAAIEALLDLALDTEDPALSLEALVDLRARLRLVASLDLRARLAAASEVLPDPARDPALLQAEWDEAYCVWSGALEPLAEEVDDAGTEAWRTTIVDAFVSGHAGSVGPEQPWAPDEFATKPAKQIIEKSQFGVVHRALLTRAATARADADLRAARDALGLFAILEDRIAGRNTPAVDGIQTMLAGPTEDIDPDWIEAQLAIAFVKRARKYCDEALEAGVLGTPDGLKGAWEGIIYSRVVAPVMVDLLPDFNQAAHMETWTAYLEAVRDDDPETAVEHSAILVERNCALQAALGIAACTATEDET